MENSRDLFLARLFIYPPPIISQILDLFIEWLQFLVLITLKVKTKNKKRKGPEIIHAYSFGNTQTQLKDVYFVCLF